MDIFNPKYTRKSGPEAKIQEAIKKLLMSKDWGVKETHGNAYQSGFPDLYCMHAKYGSRWVEVKNAAAYRFTPAQLEWFPFFASKGVGVWILTAATEAQYDLLFKPANWWHFLEIMK